MHEIALQRAPVGVAQQRYGAVSGIGLRVGLGDERFPIGTTEHIVTERQRMLEVVFFHDPGCTQAARVDVVLYAELLQHHLFQHLGQSVASRIGGVRRMLGDRPRMAIEEMTDPGIAANEDELLPGRACPERLQQPEQSFDCYVHDVGGRFLARVKVYNMGNIDEGCGRDGAIGERTPHHFDPVCLIEQPVMTKGTYARIRKSRIVKQPSNEVPPDLARSTGDKGKHALLPANS